MARRTSDRKEEKLQPNYNNVLDWLEGAEKDLGHSIRIITMMGRGEWKLPTLHTTLQMYTVMDGKAWVLSERTFYWPNNEGRDYQSTLMLELHRAYHKWDDAVYSTAP